MDGNMYCADVSAEKKYDHERERVLKAWRMLSRAVVLQIMLWYLAAFGRIVLLDRWVSWRMRERDYFSGGWSGSEVARYFSFVTGISMWIMTIKLFALLFCRAEWLKRRRRRAGAVILRRNPLRWFWMIPGQCLLDMLLFAWVIYREDLNWLEQMEQGSVMGHPGPLLLMAAMFFAACVTIGITVIACICVYVSWYRDRHSSHKPTCWL